MLYIKKGVVEYPKGTNPFDNPIGHQWFTWHVGEPVPEITRERVLTFQADGDELEIILFALNGTRRVKEKDAKHNLNPSIDSDPRLDMLVPGGGRGGVSSFVRLLLRDGLLAAREKYVSLLEKEGTSRGYYMEQKVLTERLLAIIDEIPTQGEKERISRGQEGG